MRVLLLLICSLISEPSYASGQSSVFETALGRSMQRCCGYKPIPQPSLGILGEAQASFSHPQRSLQMETLWPKAAACRMVETP